MAAFLINPSQANQPLGYREGAAAHVGEFTVRPKPIMTAVKIVVKGCTIPGDGLKFCPLSMESEVQAWP